MRKSSIAWIFGGGGSNSPLNKGFVPEAHQYNASLCETRRNSQATKSAPTPALPHEGGGLEGVPPRWGRLGGGLCKVSTRGRIVKQVELTPTPTLTRICKFASSQTNSTLSQSERGYKKTAFTLAEVFSPHSAGKRISAFTLAEVLITLGIIGVVAALTLPTLIQNHTNKVVETRLASFYSKINQALLMAEANYGDKKNWYITTNSVETDSDGNPINGSPEVEKWWNTYLAPYIKTTGITYDENGHPYFHFADGSSLSCTHLNDIRDWVFFPGDPEKCLSRNNNDVDAAFGKCAFNFIYNPDPAVNTDIGFKYHFNKGFEPYKFRWDGNFDSLRDNPNPGDMPTKLGCKDSKRLYCGTLIQMNGWKIPKDYPFKVSY